MPESTMSAHLAAVTPPSGPLPWMAGLERCPMMPTFGAPTVTFAKGKGTQLWDIAGKRYLDFLGGLAVVAIGHANDEVADAIADQARTLCHVSNLFGTTVGPEVAHTIDRLLGGGGQVFFTNSGAEANECALKLARRWGGGEHGRFQVISAYGSFHGRTMLTLAATGQPSKHEPFQPMPPGFRHAAWGDAADVERLIDDTVAGILVEPIQGEGGVNEPPVGFLSDLRRLCDDRGLLLILDEIQTGLGRTGRWFGFQHDLPDGVRPDIVTIAKSLGNGMPIGACWATAEVAASFKAGDHGSTYSGQPLAASAARATLAVLERIDAPRLAHEQGARLRSALEAMPGIDRVRGKGLLLAAELSGEALALGPAGGVQQALLAAGIVTNAVTPTALRFAPPLTVSDAEIDEAMMALRTVLASRLEGPTP